MNKLIILDRDGVINHESKDFIKSPEEWIPYPESLEALRLLKEAGFISVIATNQSGVGRNLFDEAMLCKIHEKMNNLVEAAGGKIDRIFYCPHLPDTGCACRKPKPGLLRQIRNYYKIDLKETFMVGDSWRDIEAGLSAGCPSILVMTGNGEKTCAAHHNELNNILIFDNLLTASQYVVSKTTK